MRTRSSLAYRRYSMNTLTTVRGNDPHTATRVPLPPVDGPELGHLPTDTMHARIGEIPDHMSYRAGRERPAATWSMGHRLPSYEGNEPIDHVHPAEGTT